MDKSVSVGFLCNPREFKPGKLTIACYVFIRHCNFFVPILLLDINECATNPCHRNGFCMNYPGGFACNCSTGYTGNGFACTGN